MKKSALSSYLHPVAYNVTRCPSCLFFLSAQWLGNKKYDLLSVKKPFKVGAQSVVCRFSTPLLAAKNCFVCGLASRWDEYVVALSQCLFLHGTSSKDFRHSFVQLLPRSRVTSFPSMDLWDWHKPWKGGGRFCKIGCVASDGKNQHSEQVIPAVKLGWCSQSAKRQVFTLSMIKCNGKASSSKALDVWCCRGGAGSVKQMPLISMRICDSLPQDKWHLGIQDWRRWELERDH